MITPHYIVACRSNEKLMVAYAELFHLDDADRVAHSYMQYHEELGSTVTIQDSVMGKLRLKWTYQPTEDLSEREWFKSL